PLTRQKFRNDDNARISFHALDIFTDPLPTNAYDLALLSAVLGDWDEEKRAKIVAEAWRSVKPGGALLISETLLNDDENGPAQTVMLSFYVAALTGGGGNFSAREWRQFLHGLDINNIEIVRDRESGFRDLLICRKPQSIK
ncbi:MAG: methyltransferase, partial [Pseudomonadota bacterium]